MKSQMETWLITCSPGTEKKVSSAASNMLELLCPNMFEGMLLPVMPKMPQSFVPGYFFSSMVRDPRPVQTIRMIPGIEDVKMLRSDDVELVESVVNPPSDHSPSHSQYPKDQKMLITGGPFVTFMGKFSSMKRSGDLIVEITLFGRKMLVPVREDEIEVQED